MPTAPKKRVALLITELAVGGAEKCLVHLAIGLVSHGLEPQVISLGPRPLPPQDALVAKLEQHQIPVHFLGGSSVWKLPFVALQLYRLLKQLQPDVLQTFLFHANILGAIVGGLVNVPFIAAGIRVADPRRWRLSMERRCASRQNAIVCVSQTVRDFCETTGKFPAEKLVVISNGIEVPSAKTAAADLTSISVTPSDRVLLFVGRLDPQKGLDWLIPQLPELFKRLPQHRLLLIGEGSQRSELERLVTANQLQDKVLFGGWRRDVAALLERSEMLLLPSRWEGMPNVVLEAMAASRPVVVTQAEGTVELLGPLAEGQLVPAGDGPAFLSSIERFATNPSLAQSQGQANFRRVRDHFSLAAMVAQYADLYKSEK